MPQEQVPAETVSCSWTRDPTRTVWHSVPEVELCPGDLPCNTANTDAGITSAGMYISISVVPVCFTRRLSVCLSLCPYVRNFT